DVRGLNFGKSSYGGRYPKLMAAHQASGVFSGQDPGRCPISANLNPRDLEKAFNRRSRRKRRDGMRRRSDLTAGRTSWQPADVGSRMALTTSSGRKARSPPCIKHSAILPP